MTNHSEEFNELKNKDVEHYINKFNPPLTRLVLEKFKKENSVRQLTLLRTDPASSDDKPLIIFPTVPSKRLLLKT